MFFNSIKEINRLRKEIFRLLDKGMSNIYLKVTIEKSGILKTSLSKVKKICLQVSFWGAPTNADIEFSNFLLQLKNQKAGSKNVCGFSIFFILKGIIMF